MPLAPSKQFNSLHAAVSTKTTLKEERMAVLLPVQYSNDLFFFFWHNQ